MGSLLSSVIEFLFPKQHKRIVMFGLDGSGKTAILYKLKFNQFIDTNPTIGFNVETFDVKNIRFTIWDIPGGDLIRRSFYYYLHDIDAVIFVVDSSDLQRIAYSEMVLTELLERHELKNAPVLLLANKQDVSNALSLIEVADRMQMSDRKHTYLVVGTSAYSGDGLSEGLEFLYCSMLS